MVEDSRDIEFCVGLGAIGPAVLRGIVESRDGVEGTAAVRIDLPFVMAFVLILSARPDIGRVTLFIFQPVIGRVEVQRDMQLKGGILAKYPAIGIGWSIDPARTACAIPERRRRVEAAHQPVGGIEFFPGGRYDPLIEGDHEMQLTVMRGIRPHGIRGHLDADLFATARAAGGRVVGEEGIATGMEDINITAFGPRDPPGGNPVVAFTRRIQLYIDIAVLLIEEAEVAYRSGVDEKIFYIGDIEVLIPVRKSDVFQQPVEYVEFGLEFPPVSGVPYGLHKKSAAGHAAIFLQKWELGVIAKFLGKVAGR